MKLKRYMGTKLLGRKDTDKLIKNARSLWLKSIVYKAGSQFLIDYDFPLHLYLELSRRCNYKCPMCMRKETTSGSHFPEKLAGKIITEAARKGPTSYSLHLFGEPLANPKWHRIVEMIRNAHHQNAILLTTNGFFMNESCCKKLIDLEVDKIFVSVHSLDPETYRKNTGGGDISAILDNITTFSKLSGAECKTKLFVRLFYGVDETPPNQDQLEGLRSRNIKLEVRGYHNFAGGANEWSTFKKTVKRWPCFHPWFTLGIAVDGSVTVCCADFQLGLQVGNAFDQSIEEIWKSKQVADIRKEHLNNNFERWKTCTPCDTWQFHPDIFFDFQYRNHKK